MLTKAHKQLLRALKKKSERDSRGLFVAERHKVVADLMPHFRCNLLMGSAQDIEALPSRWVEQCQQVIAMPTDYDYGGLSNMTTATPPIAIFVKPSSQSNEPPLPRGLGILLDGIQDPGNIGTIVRTAHWFGIKDIYLTPGTADPYQPKVVQSTMGSIGSVALHQLSAEGYNSLLTRMQNHDEASIVAADIQGESLYTFSANKRPEPHTLLVMGNEGNGIGAQTRTFVRHFITIPSGSANPPDSLNVGVATAICLAELTKHHKQK